MNGGPIRRDSPGMLKSLPLGLNGGQMPQPGGGGDPLSMLSQQLGSGGGGEALGLSGQPPSAMPPQPMPPPTSEATPAQAASNPTNDKGIDTQPATMFDFGGPNYADPNLGRNNPAFEGLMSFYRRKPAY